MINSDPTNRVAFEHTGCIWFCEKIQGYNVQLTKEFDFNFTRVEAKVGDLSFPVLEVTISAATKISLHGEQWFKGMPLDIANYKHYLKTKYKYKEYGAIVPREYLLEP